MSFIEILSNQRFLQLGGCWKDFLYGLILSLSVMKCLLHKSSSGFRLNASSWPMFLLKTLNGAEMAPSRIFHKVPVQGSMCIETLLSGRKLS